MGLSLGLLLNGALGYGINYKGRNHHPTNNPNPWTGDTYLLQ